MTEFYAAAATLVAVFVLLNAALKNRTGLFYAALFAAMLALVWVLDRGAGAVPIGLSDRDDRTAALSLAALCCALGFLAARSGLQERAPVSRIGRAFGVLVGVSLLLAVAVWVVPENVAVPAVNSSLGVMLIGHVIPVMRWRGPAGGRFQLPLFVAFALVVAVGILFLIYGVSPSGALPDGALYRWLYAGVALPAMVALALAVLDLRRAREAELEAAVTIAEREARTAAALLEMEKEYARARAVAARQSRQISTVQHDIRQPIAALRAEIDSFAAGAEGEAVDRLARIVSHFDALIGDLAAPGSDTDTPVGEMEDVPVTLLFSMLDRLYGADAAAKDIDLRFVASRAVFHVRAVALMRIASNLISNAISHSGGSRILVGVRRRGGGLALEVHDNGRGFAADGSVSLEEARKAGVKGEASAGTGLGLAIVDDLAAAEGYTVSVRTAPGKGTSFAVAVPG